MSFRQMCPHCAKIADFVNDYCALCWNHRTKGAVLTQEQIASSKQQYAAMRETQRKEAAFDKVQRSIMVPVVVLILWSIWLTLRTLVIMLAGGEPWLVLALSSTCFVGFAVGGYLLGGRRAIPLASTLLVAAGACSTFVFSVGLYELVAISEDVKIRSFLWDCAGLLLSGAVIFGVIRILRTERPVA